METVLVCPGDSTGIWQHYDQDIERHVFQTAPSSESPNKWSNEIDHLFYQRSLIMRDSGHDPACWHGDKPLEELDRMIDEVELALNLYA